MNNKIALITRTFQPNATIDTFDEKRFKEKFVKPLSKLLCKNKIVNKVIILTNIEDNNKYSEPLNEYGESSSLYHIKKHFNKEIKNGLIEIIQVEKWGENAGSGQALTEGAKYAESIGYKYIMNWSCEIDLSFYEIFGAFEILKKNKHSVVGFTREKWWLKFQWNLPQNTACIWNLDHLKSVGYFNPYCDNNKETIKNDLFGDIPLQGMEDFYSLLNINKSIEGFSWGMYGIEKPLKWNCETDLNTELGKLNSRKIYRQEAVINHYIEQNYDKNIKNEDILSALFSKMKIY